MTTDSQLSTFIARHRVLLTAERETEIERSSLLLSNCPPKLLEQKGLALGGLGVVGVNIGLGGKTLIELERPAAYHTTPIFPPHTFRPGDLARIEENISSAGPKKSVKARKAGNAASGDPKTQTAIEGVVYKVTDTRIVIAADSSDSSTNDLDLPDRCRVVKLANSVTYDRMEKTLDQLEKTVLPSVIPSNDGPKLTPSHELTPLIRVLLGMSPPSPKMPIQEITFFDPSLNASQKEAVRFALESPEVACIHGPPGTGKTHTLIEIIRQLATPSPLANAKPNSKSRPFRLLVCGASNLSVDNILERLLAIPPGENCELLTVTRIGHPARVMARERVLDATLEFKAGRTEQAALARDVKNELETTLDVLAGKGKGAKGKKPRGAERRKMWDDVKALRKEYRQREGGIVKNVLGESQVVLATCHSSGGRQLRDLSFDVVLIDEATQALEAVCWIPILKAKKLILAGDPMQLPPTILSLDKREKNKTKEVKKINEKKQGAKGTIINTSKKQVQKPEPTAHTKDAEPKSSTVEPGDSASSDSESSSASTSKEKSEVETAGKKKCTKVKPKKERGADMRQGLHPPRTLETTLFDRLERMYGPGIKRMLDVQYRMHAHICSFPSNTLYGAKLTSHTSVAERLLRDLPGTKADSEDEEKEILGTPVVFYDTAGCEYYERADGDDDEGSRCNENEAVVVKTWIEKLIGAGVLPSQIAIITPYQAQVTLLTSLLRPTYGPDLEIGTVDGMQGREKDAVIISLVRSNGNREVGFLKEKRRLNVAMTRAKRHLCIVGDSSTVQHGGTFLKKWLAWLESNADVRYAGIE